MYFLQLKSTQAILQLLWDVSHLDSLPKHLVERALSEQLNILTDMPLVKNSNLKNLNLVDLINYYTIHMLKLIRFLIFLIVNILKNIEFTFQNKDSNRKSYINRCVDDIKADGICVLPAVNHLVSPLHNFLRFSIELWYSVSCLMGSFLEFRVLIISNDRKSIQLLDSSNTIREIAC